MNDEYKKLGRVSTESVFKCTGKHWHEWIAILDKIGARSWTHQEIVAYLAKKRKLGPWWQQGVTTGYELAIGRRIEGQNLKGEYTLTVTKSFQVSAEQVWKVFISKEGQAAWLKPFSPVTLKPGNQFETTDGFFGEIRTLKAGVRLRMTWQDPNWDKHSVLQAYFVKRPNEKSLMAFDLGQIREFKHQAPMRKRWKSAMEDFFKLF